MQIKVKDELDNIKVNVTHRELKIIQKALQVYKVQKLNDELWDRDECSVNKLDRIRNKMEEKMTQVFKKINVW